MKCRAAFRAFVGVAWAAVAFPTLAQNLLQNPHFDGTLVPWISNDSIYDGDHSATDDGTGSAVATVPFTGGSVGISVLQQCVGGIVPGTSYSFGGAMRIPPAGAQAGSGHVRVEWHAASNCSDIAISFKETSSLSNPPGPTSTWVTLIGNDIAPAGAAGARVVVLVADDGPLPAAAVTKIRPEDGVSAFDISIDDLFLDPLPGQVPTLGGAGIAILLVSLAGAALFLLRR